MGKGGFAIVAQKELVVSVSMATGFMIKTVKAVYDRLFERIASALISGHSVAIRGFGTFEVRVSSGHKARNPATGEQVWVPERNRVVFRPSEKLTARLNAQTK